MSQPITLDAYCGAKPGTFARFIRGSKALWKLRDQIFMAKFRKNEKRVETLQARVNRLEGAGFVRVF